MVAFIDNIGPAFSGFEAFYAADFKPKLAALEPRRRRLARDCALIVAAAILLTVFAGGGVAVLFHSIGGVFSILFIGLIGAVLALNWRMENDYADANDILLGGVARFLKLEHRSDLRQPRSMETFRKYGLVPAYNVMECGDVIEGEWAGTAFAVSEAFLSKRRASRKRRKTVFTGQLIRVARGRGIDSPLVLIKRRRLIFNRRPPFDGARRVEGLPAKLDDKFRVWSAAPDNGRQTAALLATLADKLHDAYREHPLAIGFVGNQVHIAVGNGHRLTPGSMLTPLTSRKRLQRTAVAFKKILDTVELTAA